MKVVSSLKDTDKNKGDKIVRRRRSGKVRLYRINKKNPKRKARQ